eukprot:g41249.t1
MELHINDADLESIISPQVFSSIHAVVQHERRSASELAGSAFQDTSVVRSEGGRRKGYMGHLTRIANAMAQNSENGPNHTSIAQMIKELPDEERERWDKFVLGSLSEMNKKNTVDLVNMRNLHSSSDDDENDLKEFSFPQEAVLQQ